jgi:hypothetical protein
MFIVSAAMADEAAAIMATNDTDLFHGWVSGVYIPKQSMAYNRESI